MPNTVWLIWKMFYMSLVESEELLNYRKVNSTISKGLFISLLRSQLFLYRDAYCLFFFHNILSQEFFGPKHGSLSRHSQQWPNGQWSIFRELNHGHIWESSYTCKWRRDFSIIYCLLCIINRVQNCLGVCSLPRAYSYAQLEPIKAFCLTQTDSVHTSPLLLPLLSFT